VIGRATAPLVAQNLHQRVLSIVKEDPLKPNRRKAFDETHLELPSSVMPNLQQREPGHAASLLIQEL
jgi:hypothetical protein